MSSTNVFAAAFATNGPPGIIHPFLVENYAWVDLRLRELYYGYALSSDNCDEYQDAGLLKEKWDWVDKRLSENSIQTGKIMCPCHMTWANYHSKATHFYLEDIDNLDDYRLECQSPTPQNKYLFISLASPNNREYDYCEDANSVRSLDLESLSPQCSECDYESDISTLLDEFDDEWSNFNPYDN
jgi:hypothetical protein